MMTPMSEEEVKRLEYYDYMRKLGYNMLKNKRTFNVIVENSVHKDILKNVSVKKQLEIDNLLIALDHYKDVFKDCKITLFGSSTNALCQFYSDIDLCVSIKGVNPDSSEYRDTIKNLRKVLDYVLKSEYDLLYFEKIQQGEKILDEIERDGVILWEV